MAGTPGSSGALIRADADNDHPCRIAWPSTKKSGEERDVCSLPRPARAIDRRQPEHTFRRVRGFLR